MKLNKEDIQAIAQEVYNLQKADAKKEQGASVGANNRARAKNEKKQTKQDSRVFAKEKASKIGLFLIFLVGDLILLIYLMPYILR